MAEACGYFTHGWLKDAVYANSCPPTCNLKDDKEDKETEEEESDNDEDDQEVHELDMEDLLQKMNDQVNLDLWKASESWGDKENKKYVEEDCPSFKKMSNKEIFDELDSIVKQLKPGNHSQST